MNEQKIKANDINKYYKDIYIEENTVKKSINDFIIPHYDNTSIAVKLQTTPFKNARSSYRAFMDPYLEKEKEKEIKKSEEDILINFEELSTNLAEFYIKEFFKDLSEEQILEKIEKYQNIFKKEILKCKINE